MKLSFQNAFGLALLVGLVAVPLLPAVEPEAGRWVFNPPRDAFSADALLDLRSLNEKTAGEKGFVRRSEAGDSFVLGDGKPARFWAVTDYVQSRKDADLAHHARWLAKRGVNMVRWHGDITPKGKDAKLTDIDKNAREECWRLVAAMKKEGIYTTISPYWANTLKLQPGWGVAGPVDQPANALLFFDEKLQEAYKAWLKALLTEKNPHTGMSLAEDAAVALIQLQNEDSMLFWTIQSLKPEQKQALGKKFAAWLEKKYGSLDKAKTAWGSEATEGDDFSKGIVGVYIIWEFTQERTGNKAKRMVDQLQFYGETMHRFNKEMADYLHKDLGCKQLVNAGNWKTADPVKLEDVERWSYTACDVIGLNRYYTGVHVGDKAGWAIDNGDKFTDESVLLNPRAFPLNYKQVAGHPHIISESHWVPPLSYQSEGPFLVAAYQSLTGIDAFYWFSDGEEEWCPPKSANGFVPAIGKWVVATPEIVGQFPAAALMYRKGFLKQGDPAVVENRPLQGLWERRPPRIAEDKSFDPNRDSGASGEKANLKDGIDPLAFLVGPVRVRFEGDPAMSKIVDLKKYIDSEKKTVRGITGEVAWDYGKGLCTIDAPKVQGVTGFLAKGKTFNLTDVMIESTNDYATVIVAALDDKPLHTSEKVLVQIGTMAHPTDWKQKPLKFAPNKGDKEIEGFEVLSHGKAPWQLVDTQVTLTINNANLKTATLLDANGMKIQDLPVRKTEKGWQRVSLPAQTMYLVLH